MQQLSFPSFLKAPMIVTIANDPLLAIFPPMTQMTSEKTIVWFRQDLRLKDQNALSWAIQQGGEIIPVYLWTPNDEKNWAPGGASQWWLHHALKDLDLELKKHASQLIIRSAETSLKALRDLIQETGATRVCWNRRYEPEITKRDAHIKKSLREEGCQAESFSASLMYEPSLIKNKSGTPFKVFTPFWKPLKTVEAPPLCQVDIEKLKSPSTWPSSEDLDSLNLLPSIPWDRGMQCFWKPTREAALQRLQEFSEKNAYTYGELRDRPDLDGTSLLAPYLHLGQIGPREVLHHLRSSSQNSPVVEDGVLRQLYWREFASHLLFHFPNTPLKPLRPEYEHFPWTENANYLKAWQKGETGYPIVDAGMRQLWHTGWMHNRVRMIVGSFLVKHLLQHWLEGAQWFWDTLADADLANNPFGWQWIGGCGADAAPYFRIFNPITQGQKFDPKGNYVRQWVPELSKLSTKIIHSPWEGDLLELQSAGITLGKNYPHPIISHADGRAGALAAFQELKKKKEALSGYQI